MVVVSKVTKHIFGIERVNDDSFRKFHICDPVRFDRDCATAGGVVVLAGKPRPVKFFFVVNRTGIVTGEIFD